MHSGKGSDDAQAQAERIASLVFMAGRGGQIVFSALMIANDRRRYARPTLQAAALAGIVVESAWLSRRLVRARGYDDRLGVWVDCASAAGALLISQRGLGADGAAPWAKNIAIGAAIGAASTRRTEDTLGTVGTLCAAAIATGLRAGGRNAHVAGLAVNDAVSWAGTHIASRSYLNAHRRYARGRDEADALTVERAAAAAAQAERSRQHELLHQVTIGVLDEIAASSVLAAAEAAARREAARLRYALRTDGLVPRGLHQDLAELAAAASARGLRVELVADELGAIQATGAVAALGMAARLALDAARDRGGASRAVLRAVSAGDVITVTVRDHGRGFQPGTGSDHESQLLAIGDLLSPWGGTVATWSGPDSGVRVTMTISSGQARSSSRGHADDAPDGIPDDLVGQRPAGDNEDTVRDLVVNARLAGHGLAGRGLGAAEHEVGVGGFEQVDLGPSRDPFQAGPQQWRPGRYARGRGFSHQASVAPPQRSGVGRTNPFAELADPQARYADRTLLTALLAWRATGLVTGAAALAAGRARYRSAGLAVAQLALAAAESAWYARRVLRQDRWSDRTAARIDVATAAAVVLIGRANLQAADRSTWINWPPWTFAANVICGQSMSAISTMQAVTGAATVIGAHATQHKRIRDAVADSVALSAFFCVAGFLAVQTRDSAVRLEQARARAEAQGRRLAEASERSVQLRVLHDHAVQTLESIASGWCTDLDLVRSQASAEAARLDRELNLTGQADRPAADRADRLDEVLAGHADLLIEIDRPELLPVPEPALIAICGATDEALTNVRKHARTGQASVRVDTADGLLTVIIADSGVGFDQSVTAGGFGMRESIERRMSEVGGGALVESAPGSGTRITLSWPT